MTGGAAVFAFMKQTLKRYQIKWNRPKGDGGGSAWSGSALRVERL